MKEKKAEREEEEEEEREKRLLNTCDNEVCEFRVI